MILTVSDRRRAAAMLRHCNPAEPNIGGINSVLHEAEMLGRGTPLTLAIAAIAYAVSELGTADGQTALAQFALDMYDQSTNQGDNK